MGKGKKNHEKPSVAAGDYSYLKKDATPDAIRKGNYTKVTSLSYDEVDVSKEE